MKSSTKGHYSLSVLSVVRKFIRSARVSSHVDDFNTRNKVLTAKLLRGWSGSAMVLGKLPVPGRPTIWITVGQGPTALAVGAGRGCLDIFTLIYPISPLSPSLWETARYRLTYCLKEPLNPKQPTNQNFSDKDIDIINFVRPSQNFMGGILT